jgi:hypothetical protein
VREVVDRLGRDETVPALFAGCLAKAEEINVRINDHFGMTRRFLGADIKELKVVSVERDKAHVELEASYHVTVFHPALGEKRRTIRLTGPVVLSRQSGAWRVETLKSYGVDLKSTLFRPVPAETRVDAVRVATFAQLWRRNRQLSVLVENQGTSEVVVERVTAVSPSFWLFMDGTFVRKAPITLAPGASYGREIVSRARWRAAPLLVRALVGGRAVELRLDEPAHVSIVQRVRSNVPAVLQNGLTLAALAAWGLGLGPAPLGALLLLGGLGLMAYTALVLLRGPVLSMQAVYAVTGLAELAAAFLVLRGHELSFTTSLLIIVTVGVAFAPRFRNALHERRTEASGAT